MRLTLATGLAVSLAITGCVLDQTPTDPNTFVGHLDWNCPQAGTSEVPTHQQIDIQMRRSGDKLSGIQIDISEFKKILETAQKYPSLDFSGCAARVYEQARLLADRFCNDVTSTSAGKLAMRAAGVSNCDISVRGLLFPLSEVESDFYQESALSSPFAPGQRSSEDLFSEKIEEKTKALFAQCGSDIQGDPAYLDARLLSRVGQYAATQSISPECRKKVGALFVELLDEHRPKVAACKNYPSECALRNRQILEVLGQLKSVNLLPESVDSSLPNVSSLCTPTDPQLDAVDKALNGFWDLYECAEQKVGEVRSIMGKWGDSYQLTRVSEKEYRATLHMKFENPDDRGRAKACYEIARPLMRGSSGQTLSIELYDPASGRPDPGEIYIKSLKVGVTENVHTNSHAWIDSAECSLIMHETFHLFGFGDEYAPGTAGAKQSADGSWEWVNEGADRPLYNCRQILYGGAEDNIMASGDGTYYGAFPKTELSYCYCPDVLTPEARAKNGMPEPDGTCPQRLLSESPVADANHCPAPSRGLGHFVSHGDQSPFEGQLGFNAASATSFFREVKEGDGLTTRTPGVRKLYSKTTPAAKPNGAILTREQFNFITSKGCKAKTGRFELCLEESYKSSYPATPGFNFANRCDPKAQAICKSSNASKRY